MEIPYFDEAIKGASDDVVADQLEANDRGNVTLEGSEAFASLDVPNLDVAIFGSRDEIVAAELKASHGGLVAQKRLFLLLSDARPNQHRVILGAADDTLLIELNAPNGLMVRCQFDDAITGVQIGHLHLTIGRTRHNHLVVELQAENAARMDMDRIHARMRLERPYFEGAVSSPADQAVSEELQAVHNAFVASKRGHLLPGPRIPYQDVAFVQTSRHNPLLVKLQTA